MFNSVDSLQPHELPKSIKHITINLPEMSDIFDFMISECNRLGGLGLAAQQIGLPYSMFVVVIDGKFKKFINANYLPKKQSMNSAVEGCLSIPNRSYIVNRYDSIIFYGKEYANNRLYGVRKTIYDKWLSRVLQHEIDHCKGILISDIGQNADKFRFL